MNVNFDLKFVSIVESDELGFAALHIPNTSNTLTLSGVSSMIIVGNLYFFVCFFFFILSLNTL